MSNKPFKVMLAAKIDESKGFHASDLTFPKLAAGLVHLSEEAALEHSIAVLQLSRGGSR